MTIVERPVRFSGTDDQRRVNYYSHDWFRTVDGEVECGRCCAKPWHAAAGYRCGVEPPRERVEVPPGVFDLRRELGRAPTVEEFRETRR